MTARTERPVVAYRLAITLVLAAEATLLARNAWRKARRLRGYDAFANDQYARIVATEYRLPSRPSPAAGARAPGLALAARSAARRWRSAGSRRSGRDTALAALRDSRPRPPPGAGALAGATHAHVVALVLAAASPALVRASRDVPPGDPRDGARGGRRAHGRPGASGALDGVERRRRRGAPRPAALTRLWALPILVAVVVAVGFDAWRRRAVIPAVALAATSLALLAPWLANEDDAHSSASPSIGHPRPNRSSRGGPEARSARARPRARPPRDPTVRNELLPQLYAELGRLSADCGSPSPPGPGQLSRQGRRRLTRQMFVGVVPSLLALAGLVALAVLASARRSAALAVASFDCCRAALRVRRLLGAVPLVDGDTIKGTYLLMALPACCVGAAFVVDVLRPRRRVWTVVIAGCLAAVVAVQLPFLVL